MADHPHADVVRRAYAAFAAQDVPALVQLFVPDARWRSAGRNWLVGEYVGVEAILGFFTAIDAYSEGTYRTDLHDVLANDERAVALHCSSAHRSDGKAMSVDAAVEFHFRDGRIASVRAWPWDLYEEDAFYGVEPPPGTARPARGVNADPVAAERT